MTRTWFRLLSVLACCSCADPTAPIATLELVTDRSEYLFDSFGGPRIDITVRNTSTTTVQLSGCEGNVYPVPEAYIGESWRAFPQISCEAYGPLELAPGEVLELRSSVPALGTFRYRVPLFVSSSKQRLDAATSNEFTVR